MDLITSGDFDLVICEDLGRICRRAQAITIVESALDAQTRLIAINDHTDTDCENWRLTAWFAVMRHEQYNADTSARIWRTQTNQFYQGRQLPCAIYGYVKPKDARHESEMTKDPAAEPIYELIFSMLESGHSFADVADKRNELRVPLGSICRRKIWDSTMVERIVRNPILKGRREHICHIPGRGHGTYTLNRRFPQVFAAYWVGNIS